MHRLIMKKFYNNKKANSENKKQQNNQLKNIERNKYSLQYYNQITKKNKNTKN